MNLNKIWESKWFYRLLAALLAVLLFAYVNADGLNPSQRASETTSAATTERTLKVPLQLKADTDKYFITGYPEKVSVKLSGATSLVTMTANTLNFKVIADLSKLGVGTHTVKLTQSGLNKDLTYTIKPETVKVTIQDRKTKTMPIQVKYNKDSIAAGYTAATPKLSQSTVSVTGGKGEINRVYQIVANVNLTANTKTDVDQDVLLQALDSAGNTVNVVLTPQTVHVTMAVATSSKTVPVKFRQTGIEGNGLTYALSSATKTVKLYGEKADLAEIDALEIPVDVSGVTATTTRDYKVADLAAGVTSASPKTISVTITVTPVDAGTPAEPAAEESTSQSSASSSTASSSSE